MPDSHVSLAPDRSFLALNRRILNRHITTFSKRSACYPRCRGGWSAARRFCHAERSEASYFFLAPRCPQPEPNPRPFGNKKIVKTKRFERFTLSCLRRQPSLLVAALSAFFGVSAFPRFGVLSRLSRPPDESLPCAQKNTATISTATARERSRHSSFNRKSRWACCRRRGPRKRLQPR